MISERVPYLAAVFALLVLATVVTAAPSNRHF